MRASLLTFATVALAARPFVNEPDTGLETLLGSIVGDGELAPIENMVALQDFEWAARKTMNISSYTYYRNGAAGEWSYRNNLEVYARHPLRPRVMIDVTNVGNTLPTSILGYNFSAPIFIAPCAKGGYAHPDAEVNFVKGAEAGKILYMPSLFSSKKFEEIYAAVGNNSHPMFQQVYLTNDKNATRELIAKIDKTGTAKAIVLTVDGPGEAIRHRAARYSVGSANTGFKLLTWDLYKELQALTPLPIIPKGIQTVEDAREAIKAGAKAIYISNHGGRQIDTSRSSLEVALEIFNEDPDIFTEIDVLADGGIRYGTDVLKLLSLGVKAVGLGRPYMFSNVYGVEGVKKVTDILKNEIINDAANLGVADLKKVDPKIVNWKAAVNVWFS
jgi:isopentenyl diphosphate isomerase/L-lactate dehydrogenase-like FMN-dependent dehydrogenase